ncbi:Os03g0724900 [Oryza sativa Japonica Group]|uniref:Os03g0724900 protein n=1 Tax=Oryza sativa subsp. japonica TaxID=39947 RepID=Q75GV7_ORYSJ|nr:hypothetical protein [Oryza sativa Japonica Group]BAH92352.1 Os03g0724900 [Oryza sativa Japonica Group]|eukprot:NP_001173624.1 Os03g0724900 [Oryza sativa Japonica Group]
MAAAAEARSLPPWVVLDPVVRLHEPDGEEENPGWAAIRCETTAYVTLRADVEGLRRDDELSPFDDDGLKLLALVADPPRPSRLSIRLDGDPDDDEEEGRRGFLGGVLLADPDDDGYLPQVLCLLPSSAPFDRHCWGTRRPIFRSEKPKKFNAHQTFSFQGSSYWVDLGQGILSCSCHDLISNTNDDVQFRYIALPTGCNVDFDSLYLTAPPSQYRDIRCVGNSIRFVSIEGYNTLPGYNMLLSMWELMMPSSGQWRKVGSIRVGRLWEQEGFRRSGLPTNTSPTHPMLSTEDDGVVYLLMGEFYAEDEKDRSLYAFSVDMVTCKFVSAWHLPRWRHAGSPSLMGSDIFKHIKKHNLCQLIPPNKRDRGEASVLTVRPRKMQRDHLGTGSSRVQEKMR